MTGIVTKHTKKRTDRRDVAIGLSANAQDALSKFEHFQFVSLYGKNRDEIDDAYQDLMGSVGELYSNSMKAHGYAKGS